MTPHRITTQPLNTFRLSRLGSKRILVVALLATWAAASFALLLVGQMKNATDWWYSVVYLPGPIMAATASFWVSKSLRGNRRKAWVFFGLAYLAYLAGDVTWMLPGAASGVSSSFQAPAYFGYATYSVLMIIAIWYYQGRGPTVENTFVQIGNLGIIASALLLSYVLVFYPYLRAGSETANVSSAVVFGSLSLAAPIAAFAILTFHVWGRQRRVLLLILVSLCLSAGAEVYNAYLVSRASYHLSDFVNAVLILSLAFICWAAFEQKVLADDDNEDDDYTPLHEDRMKQWETLLPSLSVVGVIVVATLFRHHLSRDLLPFGVGALILFVFSLGLRSWWGHRIEMQLRRQAVQSERNIEAANQELLHEMEKRAEIQEELRHSQKMEALGQLTGGIAHDFNNLLAVVLGNLRLAKISLDDAAALEKNLAAAAKAASRGAALTERLLALSRKQALRPEVLDVDALLAGLKATLQQSLGKTIRVEIDKGKRLWPCIADAAQLENAILNLAINARDAMPGGGELRIFALNVTLNEKHAADHPEASAGSFVVIVVRDTGEGIPSEIMAKVFEPFFTTKATGQGTGLGLSMVYGFAKQSHGHTEIKSVPGQGTEVRLYLPASDTAPAREVAEHREVDIPLGRGEVVLVVEDEPAVRDLVVTLMRGLGYHTLEAGNGAEALALLTRGQRIDLLLSDIVLPGGMSGRELSNRIVEERPEIKVLLMSGYAAETLERDGELKPGEALLYKPFSAEDLARKARSALDAKGADHLPAARG